MATKLWFRWFTPSKEIREQLVRQGWFGKERGVRDILTQLETLYRTMGAPTSVLQRMKTKNRQTLRIGTFLPKEPNNDESS